MSAFSLRFDQHGLPSEVLQLEQHAVPQPKRGEVLVEMQAAPINPSDRLHILGQYQQQTDLPSRVGFEGVGTVIESGGGMLGRFLQGQRVAVLASHGGTWASHCVVNAKQAIPVPKAIPLQQAAQYFINPATAFLLTQQVARLVPGDVLVQSAGTSTVGRQVISLGRHFGFKTISVVRRAEAIQELKNLGADLVITTTQLSNLKQIRKQIVDQVGVLPRFAIDSIGGTLGSQLLALLRHNGRMVCFGTASEEPLSINPRTLMEHQLSIESFWLGPFMRKQSLLKKIGVISSLKSLHLKNLFPAPVAHMFAMTDYAAALEQAVSIPGGEKVLLTMNSERPVT